MVHKGGEHLTPMQQVHAVWLQLLTKVDALMARHPQATLRGESAPLAFRDLDWFQRARPWNKKDPETLI